MNKGFRARSGRKFIVSMGLLAVVMLLSACGGAAAPITEATLIGPQEYQAQFGQASHALIDVRTAQEFNSGHIPGAVNIPVEAIADRLDEVPRGQPVVVYCRSGNRSAVAAEILVENGFQPVLDLGGIQDWTAQGFAVE